MVNNLSSTQLSDSLASNTGGNGIINCLSDCSNHGTCSLTNSVYECNCDVGYDGSACQNDLKSCSSNPCINGGKCIDDLDDFSFTCECNFPYYGINCENQINLCENSIIYNDLYLDGVSKFFKFDIKNELGSSFIVFEVSRKRDL